MLILQNTWCRNDPHPACAKHRRGVAHTEGFELKNLMVERPIHLRQIDGCVNSQHRLQVGGRQSSARMQLKPPCEFRDMLRRQGESRRLRMPAKTVEQVAH